jgi:hypothetical protein
MSSYRPSSLSASDEKSRLLRAAAALGLVVFLGGLGLPLLGLVLDDERVPLCGRTGRCCCAEAAAGTDERTCLRRGCGCGPMGEAFAGAPLRIEAVLPAADTPVTVAPVEARWEAVAERPRPRAEAPPVPPPKRPLPA